MLTIKKETSLAPKAVFDKIVEFEDVISKMDGAKFGDDACPLRHVFGDGLYIREITMPAGTVVSSKIHKTTHPYFVLEGEVSVLTEDGFIRIKAPYWGMTKAGTKRILQIHKETIWITVHATKETDLKKIEDEIIAENYEALPECIRLEIEGKS